VFLVIFTTDGPPGTGHRGGRFRFYVLSYHSFVRAGGACFVQRHYTRSRKEFQPFYFEIYLPLAIIIQPLSLLDIFSSIPSSSSSPILVVLAFVVCLFFVFLFNASASASSTSPRISYVLKTNFTSIARRFPFLRSLHSHDSSLASATSFRKRAFLKLSFREPTPVTRYTASRESRK
jgi:hypothetical protein